MKYLAKVCTSALTFGLLMAGGSVVASAHHINPNQNLVNQPQKTTVTDQNNQSQTYPIYHFHNHYHLSKDFINPIHHHNHVAKGTRRTLKLASVNSVKNNDNDYKDDVYSQNTTSAKSNSAKTYYYRGNFYSNKDSYRAARFSHSRMGKLANTKLGDPYVWGATGANAFDCSGFTQYLYHHAKHINLPRTAQAQYDYEKHVSYRHVKPGDLVFFGYSPRAIAHVGMYIGNGKMIDAQNRGVITEYVKAPWWNLVGCARVHRHLVID